MIESIDSHVLKFIAPFGEGSCLTAMCFVLSDIICNGMFTTDLQTFDLKMCCRLLHKCQIYIFMFQFYPIVTPTVLS